MKVFQRFTKLLTILLIGAGIFFSGCDKSSVFSPDTSIDVTDAAFSNGKKQPNFLKLKSDRQGLNKVEKTKKWIYRFWGGRLHLQHGASNDPEANNLYAVDLKSPYNVYKVDPTNLSNPELVGQLAFSTAGIALNPQNGKIYYAERLVGDGFYQTAAFDPATGTNEILPGGTYTRPGQRLAFHPDGRLFCTYEDEGDKLYTIDTGSGNWTLFANLSESLLGGGDMTFSPDGQLLYSVGGANAKLQVTDVASGVVTTKQNTIGPVAIRGLNFGNDGQLYFATLDAQIGMVDFSTGVGTIFGSTGLARIDDLAPVIASTELTYSDVTLDIPRYALNENKEIEITLETTELMGGVAMTFSPHGTVFNTPAILNIEAHGVDFTGVDPNSVNIFYDNPDTGQWEPMNRDDVIIDINAGTVTVVNARLPHFSRYGVAAD